MKTICIYHSRDLDGLMSGAIVKKWFEENHKNTEVFEQGCPPEERIKGEDPNVLVMKGWDYDDGIPNLTAYDKVIMCDISFPVEIMDKIREDKGDKFIWIDHHKSAIKEMSDLYGVEAIEGLQNSNAAACELTWMYFFLPHVTSTTLDWEGMPEIVRLLGRYDCFGHKGTDEEQMVLDFQYGARQVISNYEEAYDYLNGWIDEVDITPITRRGQIIYDYLATNAKQIYSKAFPIELIEKQYFNNKYTGEKIYRKFLCANIGGFNPNSFNLPYTKDGYNGFASFVYSNSKKGWTFTLMSETIDVSKIAKQYGGGGHKGAAGFIIEDLKQIIK